MTKSISDTFDDVQLNRFERIWRKAELIISVSPHQFFVALFMNYYQNYIALKYVVNLCWKNFISSFIHEMCVCCGCMYRLFIFVFWIICIGPKLAIICLSHLFLLQPHKWVVATFSQQTLPLLHPIPVKWLQK